MAVNIKFRGTCLVIDNPQDIYTKFKICIQLSIIILWNNKRLKIL